MGTEKKSPSKITKILNTSPKFQLVLLLNPSQLFPTLDHPTSGSTQAHAMLLLAGTMIPTIVKSHPLINLMDKHLILHTDQDQSQDSYQLTLHTLEMSTLKTSHSVK